MSTSKVEVPVSEAPPDARARPAHRLLARLRASERIPTVGLTVPKILQLSRSADGSIAELANQILADVHLTQKVLTLANAAMYRRSFSQPVTTITRAIVLLGFEQVRMLAMGVIMLDKIQDPQQSAALRYELLHAACASAVAQQLADRHLERYREEASIAALLLNFGRVMVGAMDFDAYRTIVTRVAGGESEASASARVLGCSFGELTIDVLNEMGVPAPLVGTIESVAQSAAAAGSAGRGPTLPSLVDCAAVIGTALLERDPQRRDKALTKIVAERGRAMELDRPKLDAIVVTTLEGMEELRTAIEEVADPLQSILSRSTGAARAPGVGGQMGMPVAEPAFSAEEIDDGLAQRPPLQEAIRRLCSDTPQPGGLVATLRGALDAMRECFELDRSILMFRDGAALQAKLWSGAIAAPLGAAIRSPLGGSTADLVGLVTGRGVDVQLRDLTDPKLASRMPSWAMRMSPSPRSLLVMPLLNQGKPIGCLLGDRATSRAEILSELELELLRQLKRHIVASLRTLRI